MKKLSLTLSVIGVVALAVSANANLLVNGGFDTGNYNGWTAVSAQSPDGPFTSGANFFTVSSPDGSPYIGGAAASYGTKNVVIAQQITLPNVAGTVDVSFQGWTTNQQSSGAPGGQFDTYSQVGYDPTGGVDPTAASVIWSGKVGADATWETQSVSAANVPGGTGTVFVSTTQLYALQWNVNYYDNVQANVVPEPSSILALATGMFGLAGVVLRKRS